MLDNNIKASFKKYLLAFTFLLGFFALSGYVSHSSTNGNRISGTELFTDKNFFSKGGISYKRAALAFYTNTSSYTASRKNVIQRVNTDNRLILIRYRYLKYLFLSTKHYFAYPIDHLYHRADQYNNTTFSQIG